MGFTVLENVEFAQYPNVSVANTQYTLNGSYELKKNPNNTYNIHSYAKVYTSGDHSKPPIDMIGVTLWNLAELPADIFAALYIALKALPRFAGKTFVDN